MCLLMLRPPLRSPAADPPALLIIPGRPKFTTSSCSATLLFFNFLPVLALICFCASSTSASSVNMAQVAAFPAPAAPHSEHRSTPSTLTAQELLPSQHHLHEKAVENGLSTTPSGLHKQTSPQVLHGPWRMHRRLGFDLEKAYQVLCKKGTYCEGRSRRWRDFRMMHEVPSGPNPISNYLPSKFSSSWAPSPPPSLSSSSP
ncbi:hypothetical protein GOP47_0000584 [Adiantum capillus-veneris]|uniref:Uncharacterized protein n=1 Tax=Adiantum capillus-veneris TaxID=13818 RepID=A0A9D4ZT78_ADICA|nr:hypothetical protein GOP47_0000584 [Adiantum capillus-veneris]